MLTDDITLPADTLFLGVHRFRWLATAASTGGTFSCADIVAVRGAEPPRHTHTREDQAFVLLEGAVTFTVGDERIDAEPASSCGPRAVSPTGSRSARRRHACWR
jgi:quercetin dioxygenase-like cupin family protein